MDRDRVLIVSPHPLFREGIIRLLGDQVEIVGAVADLKEAKAVIRQRQPRTIIVDHESTELKEADLAPLLWPETEALRVIYVTLAGNQMIVHNRQRVTGVNEADLLRAIETPAEEGRRLTTALGRRAAEGVWAAVTGRDKGGNWMKKLTIPGVLTVIVSILLIIILQRADLTPVEASQQSQVIDTLIRGLFYIAAVIFALCLVFFFYSMVAFRRRPGDLEDAIPVEGSTPLEIAWTVVPLIIVLSVGAYSAGVLFDISAAPSNPGHELEVKVTGFQWAWRFEYPELEITTSELVLPVNRPVLFRLYSTDVIHSFYVPEFRLKMDAIPGIENQIRITPTQVGEYKVRCAELCGTGHAYMLAPVRVVEEAAFQEWVQAQTAPAPAPETELAKQGQALAEQFGCVACHSTDGSRLVGPTWKGLYGSTRTFEDGTTAQADEEYLRNSILDPGAQIVQGFPDVMPKNFKDQLTEEQLQAIIEYIKSLK